MLVKSNRKIDSESDLDGLPSYFVPLIPPHPPTPPLTRRVLNVFPYEPRAGAAGTSAGAFPPSSPGEFNYSGRDEEFKHKPNGPRAWKCVW
ncbi:hypothetical protein EVAR_45603_1 [Eumeta japonica]|uniref:Uncharacterized protein n=1 Tax=Eumeta variegata TaxID=151549 RepID=A0A4C1YZ12_EUMVA|nr:hypothetical protein EVAR_45603_1 [Eumeta japonica]